MVLQRLEGLDDSRHAHASARRCVGVPMLAGVLEAQLQRIHADRLGAHVDHALDREGQIGEPGARYAAAFGRLHTTS